MECYSICYLESPKWRHSWKGEVTWSHAGTPAQEPILNHTLHTEAMWGFLSTTEEWRKIIHMCRSHSHLSFPLQVFTEKKYFTSFSGLWKCLTIPLMASPTPSWIWPVFNSGGHTMGNVLETTAISAVIKSVRYDFWLLWDFKVRTWFAVWRNGDKSSHHPRGLLRWRSPAHSVFVLHASHQFAHQYPLQAAIIYSFPEPTAAWKPTQQQSGIQLRVIIMNNVIMELPKS